MCVDGLHALNSFEKARPENARGPLVQQPVVLRFRENMTLATRYPTEAGDLGDQPLLSTTHPEESPPSSMIFSSTDVAR